MKTHLKFLIPVLVLLVCMSCSEKDTHAHDTVADKSYAIYAEYAKGNILMKDGLNRRIFDTVEAQHGSRIRLEQDGSITLQPGTYRMTGFSLVTVQTTTEIPAPKYNNTYTGYCIVYNKKDESDTAGILRNRIGIGSATTALYLAPSTFDLVYTCRDEVQICVGHQSGDTLHNEVYFQVNDVGGIVSPYHVFARVAISEL